MSFGGAPKCKRCSKSVYAAEKRLAAGSAFHIRCFSCASCKTRLDSTSLKDNKETGEIYCSSCHGKNFGPKGYGFGGGAGVLAHTGVGKSAPVAASASSSSSSSSAAASAGGAKVGCAACRSGGQAGRFCGECGTPLSAGGGAAAAAKPAPRPAGIAAVRSVYQGSGAAAAAKLGGGARCVRCSKSVYENEKKMAAGQAYHKRCFTCFACKSGVGIHYREHVFKAQAGQPLPAGVREGMTEIFCVACHGKHFGPKGIGYGSALTHTQ